jgi:LacI family transcriptional regulator
VFAGSDAIAVGVLGALEEAGLRVPRDVSLVGYDDIQLAGDLRPQLTTVHVPYEELGRTAVRMALDGGRGPEGRPAQRAVLGTHVVVRDSVGRPASR